MRSQRTLRNICSAVIPSIRWHVTERVPAASIATSTSISPLGVRYGSGSSSKQWLIRQMNDAARKEAELRGLKSRAGIKLLEIDKKYKIFRSGQTVVDLGYAPGAWSQVAVDRTSPFGRVLGIDIIPTLPPKGASAMQGDFASERVQQEMKRFLSNPKRGRPLRPRIKAEDAAKGEVEAASQAYIEQERAMMKEEEEWAKAGASEGGENSVDVLLSDMLEPFAMSIGTKTSLRLPYRLMTTSGHTLRDQVGSIKLCNTALAFSIDVLKPGGSFVCKFYQSGDSKLLREKFMQVYDLVYISKPDSSRPESKELYLVALKKKPEVDKEKVMSMKPTDEF